MSLTDLTEMKKAEILGKKGLINHYGENLCERIECRHYSLLGEDSICDALYCPYHKEKGD
jgi:hypothetical protein